MKIGDLVWYTIDDNSDDHDRLGIITSFDEHYTERIWVHWFESGNEQWAEPEWLEILSESR